MTKVFDTETVTVIPPKERPIVAPNQRGNNSQMAYYSFDKIYSYNAIYNFIVGARGLGKTYGWKKKVIAAAIKRGDQFIYLRRYKDELKASRNTFFADIYHEFPKWDFRINGEYAEMAPAKTRDEGKKREWQVIGHFMPLSIAQGRKSVAYPLVTNIGYDEFILEKGMTHYLPDEANAFNQLYSTVDRNREKTKVFFMANAVSITNPYFIEYEIKDIKVGDLITKAPDKNGIPFVACHFADSKEFTAQVYETRFGQFIKDTEYGAFAVGNEFADNNENLLEFKTSAARYHYSLETRYGVFTVWVDWANNMYYIQSKRPGQETLYTLLSDKMDVGKTLMLQNDKMLSRLRTAFNSGRLKFDEPKSRNAFIEIFRR